MSLNAPNTIQNIKIMHRKMCKHIYKSIKKISMFFLFESVIYSISVL